MRRGEEEKEGQEEEEKAFSLQEGRKRESFKPEELLLK